MAICSQDINKEVVMLLMLGVSWLDGQSFHQFQALELVALKI